jgi:S1-C subfamily serine protease
MNNVDWNLKCIVFKACLVAIWSDATMSADERRYISHLTEVLADTEEEREALRKIAVHDQNEDQVLSEIEQLGQQEKTYVFDTCLDILASDRLLDAQEVTFLATLRKTCGIGLCSYRKKLSKARTKAGARVALSKRVLGVAAIIQITVGVLILAYFHYHFHLREVDITPEEEGTRREILISTLEPDSIEQPIMQTGQEVYQHVRNSIVSVNLFLNNDPLGGGSGSVIGKDDAGTFYVVTNKHVLFNPDTEKGKPRDRVRIEVQQQSGARFDADFDFYSRKHDIALLAVKGMEQYTEPLKLTLKSDLRVGQPVYAVGSPIGLAHTLTAGVVSALRDSYLQTDATIHSGSSGGPLIDQRGALCGVVAKSHRTKNYSFALYADIILEVLEERTELAAESSDESKPKDTPPAPTDPH